MFEKQYKAANDSICPDEELLDAVLVQIRRGKQKYPRTGLVYTLGTVAAGFIVLFTGTLAVPALLQANRSVQKPVQLVQTEMAADHDAVSDDAQTAAVPVLPKTDAVGGECYDVVAASAEPSPMSPKAETKELILEARPIVVRPRVTPIPLADEPVPESADTTNGNAAAADSVCVKPEEQSSMLSGNHPEDEAAMPTEKTAKVDENAQVAAMSATVDNASAELEQDAYIASDTEDSAMRSELFRAVAPSAMPETELEPHVGGSAQPMNGALPAGLVYAGRESTDVGAVYYYEGQGQTLMITAFEDEESVLAHLQQNPSETETIAGAQAVVVHSDETVTGYCMKNGRGYELIGTGLTQQQLREVIASLN